MNSDISAEVKRSTVASDTHRLLTRLQSITRRMHVHTQTHTRAQQTHTWTYQGRSSTLHCLRICEWKNGLTHLAARQDFLRSFLGGLEELIVCLLVGLSVRQSVCLLVCQICIPALSVCLNFWLLYCACMSGCIWLFSCTTVYLFPCVCLPSCLFFLSVCLFLFVYLSVCMSTCLFATVFV